MKKLFYFLPLVFFFVLAAFLLKGLELDPSAMPSALIDKPVPSFQLDTLESDTVMTEKDLTSKVLLLNVWATWCVSCRIEHPYLLKMAETGVNIVGLNYKDNDEQARAWLAELGNPYLFNLRDNNGKLGLDLGVFGAPETFVIDKRGVIRFRHVGVIDDRIWTEILKPVVDQLTSER
ncbi:MAG: DsbE family thiol:disulfide interchange protein [Pseudomonadales bacterium]|nr:DsbE family thiol:disulfide interchange protein [Pseudomonadales bacterium]